MSAPHVYVSTGKAAKLSRLSMQTVIRGCDAGKFASFVLPGSTHRRVRLDSLRDYLAEHNVPTDLIDAYIEGRLS